MEDEIRRFVAAARVGRLATASKGGSPHVVPVCFVLEGERVYIALDEKPKRVPVERLRRVRNLLENPRVQLLVDHYEEDWARLRLAQLSGLAALAEPGGEEHRRALALLRAKYRQYEAMALESRPVIAIALTGVVAWKARESPTDSNG